MKRSELLSKKPSELIQLALGDLEKCEADMRYRVGMYTWHEPYVDTCVVCLAGSVMAQSMNASTNKNLRPSSYHGNDGAKIAKTLGAINAFRGGCVRHGLSLLGITEVPDGVPRMVQCASYHDQQTQFKADMRAMADMLEANGL